MPTYNYKCEPCCIVFEATARIAQYDQPTDCPKCGASAPRTYTPNINGFILAGVGWTGKEMTINNQMQKKNERLDRKQEVLKREAPGIQLVPNVGGERVDSWSDAKKLAASKGKDSGSYDAMVRKEKSK